MAVERELAWEFSKTGCVVPALNCDFVRPVWHRLDHVKSFASKILISLTAMNRQWFNCSNQNLFVVIELTHCVYYRRVRALGTCPHNGNWSLPRSSPCQSWFSNWNLYKRLWAMKAILGKMGKSCQQQPIQKTILHSLQQWFPIKGNTCWKGYAFPSSLHSNSKRKYSNIAM